MTTSMTKNATSTDTAKRKRFIIEGTWSGYTSSQSRVVHRTVHSPSWKKLRAWADAAHGICYTDGTMLYLTVRDCKPRERVHQIKGYDSLIMDCYYANVNSVAALQRVRAQRAAERQDSHAP